MSSSSVDATASPFVIAITNAGIKGLPSVINAIMIAVLSVGNSSIYGCSRTIASLAEQGLAPKVLGYIDREGRPLYGIIIIPVFGLLAYVCASDKKDDVFNWLLALWYLFYFYLGLYLSLSYSVPPRHERPGP